MALVDYTSISAKFDNTTDMIQKPATDTLSYPASDEVTVLGPVYLPRIYGKDLTAFEIASSGKIAITLQDVHSFDLERSGNDVRFEAKPSDNFKFLTDRTTFYSTAGGDVTLVADSNISMTASNNFSLKTVADMTFVANSDAVMAASNDVTVSASNNLTMVAFSNVLLRADNDSMQLESASNMSQYAGQDLFVAAHSNLYLTASNQDMVLVASSNLMGTASNISWMASNMQLTASNFTLTASNDVTITSSNVFVGASNLGIATSNTVFHASNNFMISASNTLSLHAETLEMDVGSISQIIGDNYSLTANGYISLASSTSNIKLTSASNVDMVVGKDLIADVARNMTFTSGGTVEFTASNEFNVHATSNVGVYGWNDTVYFAGTQDHAILAAGNTYIDLTYDSNITCRATDFTFTAYDGAATNDIMVVGKQKVTINGDLDIQGVVNSTYVTESNLMVEDKRIVLGAVKGDVQDSSNNGAGIFVQGLPTGETATDQTDIDDATVFKYEKSIRYSHPSAASWNNLGTVDGFVTGSGASAGFKEPYWNVKGGSLAISHSNAAQDVSYGFRINELSELEIVKKYYESSSSSYKYKKIAKFGRSML